MINWKIHIGCAILTGLLLTGCEAAKDDSQDATKTNVEQEDNENHSAHQKNGSPEKNNKVRLMEKNLQYKRNGRTIEKTAFLKKSNNQPFSLYVLQQFKLSAVEPGKDVLVLKEDDSIFMRIELLARDTDWDEAEENTKLQLKSLSGTISDPGLDVGNGTGFEVKNGDEVITSVLIKNENEPLRLTMFTQKDKDYRDAFLEMAKTLSKD
ncbi:hypothetical protein [Bacillus sp. mrc49]|uniref:hypothetical protein n=1 Tax=Bacillus sp. mrc49 TaxID=2054913 RepID=UPI000C276FB1|nr:hypothetical protein [Bacillus sp. mrc49]PJN86958.1 hypothetical protein CVN76_28350 [Bacillus sp. mrc49]